MNKKAFSKISSFLAGATLTIIVGCPTPTTTVNSSTAPTLSPTTAPTAVSSPAPTAAPTVMPTSAGTTTPTTAPTVVPTAVPTPAAMQVDRLGNPSIALVFVGYNGFTKQAGVTLSAGNTGLDTYNTQSPSTDIGNYRAAFSGALQKVFNRSVADADAVASALTPDVISIDMTKPTRFPNGRALKDDVVDTELQLLSGVSSATDKIDSNDNMFSTSFPYLASPW
jgi:hypothetical protein